MRHWSGLMFVLALVSCSKTQNADCPAGTKRALGRCLTICVSDDDCLSSERCDTTLAICAADLGDPDASTTDAAPEDANEVDAGAVSCGMFGEGECNDQPGCSEARCPTCPDGSSRFVVCVGPGDPVPDCAPPMCNQCRGLGEDGCATTPGCKASYCADCNGVQHFSLCLNETDPDVACPALICCNNFTDETTCDANPACHPVYYREANCTCPVLGCCMRFSYCADGEFARCEGMVTCRAAEPVCEGPYVVSYREQCYEGCARIGDCMP